MSHQHAYDTINKQEVRKIVLNLGKKKKPAKYFLCFPARECLDLKQALDAGVIDKTTGIVAIERDKNDREIIEKFLSENFDWYVTCKSLYEMEQRTHDQNDDLSGTKPFIDLAYIDICGCVTQKFVESLIKCRHLFKKNSKISITTYSANRGCSEYVNSLVKYCKQSEPFCDFKFHAFGFDKEYDCNKWCIYDNAYQHNDIIMFALGLKHKSLTDQIIYRKSSRTVPMFVHVYKK